MTSVLINDLVLAAMQRQDWTSEASVARALGAEPVRLYQWKTHRRRMPATAVLQLAILAGYDTTFALGKYGEEWELVKNHPDLIGSR